ncbi:MAG TPA: hypothetical protein PKA20_17465, partial [Burkholderiaceae bacterium]|nr:hypothetical protein [Burkholderiaceae bacterium]
MLAFDGAGVDMTDEWQDIVSMALELGKLLPGLVERHHHAVLPDDDLGDLWLRRRRRFRRRDGLLLELTARSGRQGMRLGCLRIAEAAARPLGILRELCLLQRWALAAAILLDQPITLARRGHGQALAAQLVVGQSKLLGRERGSEGRVGH